ncbi:MAG: Asp-tRNA(Asn)/Glu-tRNA(Gln) amidotransferase subunit GatA [Patescibacteria group bacterium]
MKLSGLSIQELHTKLVAREFSAVELADDCIARIEKTDHDMHAFVHYNFDGARSQAAAIDAQIARGDTLPALAGIPCAVKENIVVEGLRSTASSKILEQYVAPYDAYVIEKLKSNGAVMVGKTNMDEFAMGSSTENSAFFPTKNPTDPSRVPGGSSGGSAAAVAAHYAVYALGSDTGGSIRQPASLCGVVGLKPTYGAVSRSGLMAMASSLDQIGPLARTVEDARIVFDAIRGYDEKDATSVEARVRNSERDIRNLRIGIPKEYFGEGIDPSVRAVIETTLAALEKEGCTLTEVSLPHTPYAISAYYIIMPAEVSSNLARYDGMKYGYSTHGRSTHDALQDIYVRSRTEGFGREVKRRIMLGTYVLSAGYYDAYYKKAQQVRTKIVEDFSNAFNTVDVIATSTTPTTAFRFGEKTEDPLSMYLEDVFTVPVNLAGIPAISVPCGVVNGLPVGMQFIAPWFAEERLFHAGALCEKVRGTTDKTNA